MPHRHGAQGVLDTASKAALQNEFGTSDEDAIMVKILEGGEFQAATVSVHQLRGLVYNEHRTNHPQARERQGGKNDSKGAMGTSR